MTTIKRRSRTRQRVSAKEWALKQKSPKDFDPEYDLCPDDFLPAPKFISGERAQELNQQICADRFWFKFSFPLLKSICELTPGGQWGTQVGLCTILCYLVNFARKVRAYEHKNGWFYFRESTAERDLCMNRDVQHRMLSKLVSLGLIEQERRGMPSRRWIRVNIELLAEMAEKVLDERFRLLAEAEPKQKEQRGITHPDHDVDDDPDLVDRLMNEDDESPDDWNDVTDEYDVPDDWDDDDEE